MTAIIDSTPDTGADSDVGYVNRGMFSLSISGLADSTATVKRSYDGGSTYFDVEAFTADTEKTGFEGEGAEYKVSISGGTDTGVTTRIGQTPGLSHYGS